MTVRVKGRVRVKMNNDDDDDDSKSGISNVEGEGG